MQNRSMPADPHPTPGALLMGDAFNIRHPFNWRWNDCGTFRHFRTPRSP